MSRFYVGQRVRIKWSNAWPELGGQVGTIISVADPERVAPGERCDWVVAPDVWGCELAPDFSAHFAPAEEQLEPATDSYDKIEWKDCLWMPEHMWETV